MFFGAPAWGECAANHLLAVNEILKIIKPKAGFSTDIVSNFCNNALFDSITVCRDSASDRNRFNKWPTSQIASINRQNQNMNSSQPTTASPAGYSKLISPALLALLLIAVGVASRIGLADSPNFKPVCALALFAGFYFRNLWAALGVVAATLLISDAFIGGYELPLMLAVYASTALAGCLGIWVKRWHGNQTQVRSLFGKFAVASLVMSTAFFVFTNFAVWGTSNWYPLTLASLGECFAAAVPFYRWTLISDFVFSQMTVLAYAGAMVSVKAFKPAKVFVG